MEKQSQAFLFSDEIGWEPAGEGVFRQIMGYDDRMMLVKVKFNRGAAGAPHSHPHTQSTLVLSGVFEFCIGNEKHRVQEGDGLYMQPGVVHSCICLKEGCLLDAFSPLREDFLEKDKK